MGHKKHEVVVKVKIRLVYYLKHSCVCTCVTSVKLYILTVKCHIPLLTSRENKEPRNVKLLHPTLLITCSWNRDAVSALQKQCLLSQCERNARNIPDYSDETAVCLTGENKDHSLND